jgi:hypothetical protein
LIGIAGLAAVAALIYYSGLLTPDAGKPDASPPVLPTKPRAPESDALPGAPDQSGARSVQTPPPPVPDKQTAQPGPGVGAEPTPSVKPALPRAPTGPQVQGQPSIEALLRQAERQLKAGRLTEPPGDNAFESYNRVLDLAPENLQAEEALVKIGRINAANMVFSSADTLLRQGAIDQARRMIDTGLKMNPDDERLLGLRRALE